MDERALVSILISILDGWSMTHVVLSMSRTLAGEKMMLRTTNLLALRGQGKPVTTNDSVKVVAWLVVPFPSGKGSV